MLEYNMTKNILLIAFWILSFYTALKLIWMFSLFKQINLTNLNLKLKNFKNC